MASIPDNGPDRHDHSAVGESVSEVQQHQNDLPAYTSPGQSGFMRPSGSYIGGAENLNISNEARQPGTGVQPMNASTESLSQHEGRISDFAHPPSDAETPSERYQKTSELIYLSTVVDLMAACEAPSPSSFCYFTDVVDCPLLAPFDQFNWTRMKQHIAYLGFQHVLIAECLVAVQAIYRAQVDHLPKTHAMSVYQAAVTSFKTTPGNDSVDFHIILVSAFLICLCTVTLPNEDVSHLEAFNDVFEVRLEAWLRSQYSSSESLRICAWPQLLNTATKHPGSLGLFPVSVMHLLYTHVKEVPSLASIDNDSLPEHVLYDAIATPVFGFYLHLQRISNQITDLTHYRRSRTTAEDQAEVTGLLDGLKEDLARLWSTRPAPLNLQPYQIRDHFSTAISGPLIALSSLCIAAFHTEYIVISRIRGDSSFPSPEAKYPLDQIRRSLQEEWNSSIDGKLNPGYARPLFVYALESPHKDESDWAAGQLRQIKNPVSRSNFLASFVEAHGEAQRAQGRRVTMKYFCYQTFGVPLPYM